MNINITGLHMHISDGLNDYITKKIRKLNKYNDKLTEADVAISKEKNLKVTRITLFGKNLKFKCESHAGDIYDSVNGAISKLEKRLRRLHTKKVEHPKHSFSWIEHKIFHGHAQEEAKNAETDDIIEMENFELKPMSIYEALAQLKLNENKKNTNNFILFNDATNHKFCVLYKRKDNKYGLIQPE